MHRNRLLQLISLPLTGALNSLARTFCFLSDLLLPVLGHLLQGHSQIPVSHEGPICLDLWLPPSDTHFTCAAASAAARLLSLILTSFPLPIWSKFQDYHFIYPFHVCMVDPKCQPFSIRRCLSAQLLSGVQLFATPWTVALQAPLYGILQARTLDWVAISFSGGSS